MKSIKIAIAFLILIVLNIDAQDNPYAAFGLPTPTMPDVSIRQETEVFVLQNSDTAANIKTLVLDVVNKNYKLFSKTNELLMQDTLLDFDQARWFAPDPKQQYFSPYNGMGNNPLNNVDPTGGEDSPIYDQNGILLGTDNQGLQGQGIIMDKKNFKQGMDHDLAMSFSLGYSGLNGDVARNNYHNSYTNLKNRPDWDGYLTKAEADKWWKNGKGQPLFVDASKIDLANIYKENLTLNKAVPINFLFKCNHCDVAEVYGTIDLTLLSDGSIKIGYATKINGRFMLDSYGFEMHDWSSEPLRNIATKIGKPNGNGNTFDIHGYGSGHLNKSSIWAK